MDDVEVQGLGVGADRVLTAGPLANHVGNRSPFAWSATHEEKTYGLAHIVSAWSTSASSGMGPDIDRLPPEVERKPRMDTKVRDRVVTRASGSRSRCRRSGSARSSRPGVFLARISNPVSGQRF